MTLRTRFGRRATPRPVLLSYLLALLAIAGLWIGCGGGNSGDAAGDDVSGRLVQVTTTTGMIADIARNVGGDRVNVTALMGPGVDPHLYKATQSDLEKLSGADVIFYNGLHLEGKMTDIFVKMARTRATLPVTENVPDGELREPPEFGGSYDPHIWFDVSLWTTAVDAVADELKRLDPEHAAGYEERAATYRATLTELHAWCVEEIAKIPEERRVLVTAHDAFGYFGRAYGIEVLGLQGISTVAEFGLQDLTRLIDTIVSRRVSAVFVESSVPKRSIEALVKGCNDRGHPVKIGGELFSDAMGQAGTPEGSYVGMVRHNVHTIVEALK